MIKHLKMTNVGPAAKMELEFGKRLNLLTGDNGLGKSFLLDIAWWALTRRWPAEINQKLTAGKRRSLLLKGEPKSVSLFLARARKRVMKAVIFARNKPGPDGQEDQQILDWYFMLCRMVALQSGIQIVIIGVHKVD